MTGLCRASPAASAGAKAGPHPASPVCGLPHAHISFHLVSGTPAGLTTPRSMPHSSPRPPSRGPASVLAAVSAVELALHRLRRWRESGMGPGSGAGATVGGRRREVTEDRCVNPVAQAGEEASAAGASLAASIAASSGRGSFTVMRASFQAKGGTRCPCFARHRAGVGAGPRAGVSRRRGSRA